MRFLLDECAKKGFCRFFFDKSYFFNFNNYKFSKCFFTFMQLKVRTTNNSIHLQKTGRFCKGCYL